MGTMGEGKKRGKEARGAEKNVEYNKNNKNGKNDAT